jgi:hypothetical protein
MHEKAHFMALSKTGVITNQYGKTPTMPDNFQCKSPPLRNVLWCARQSPFMALCKLGFIIFQHVYKLQVAKHVLSQYLILDLNELF